MSDTLDTGDGADGEDGDGDGEDGCLGAWVLGQWIFAALEIYAPLAGCCTFDQWLLLIDAR